MLALGIGGVVLAYLFAGIVTGAIVLAALPDESNPENPVFFCLVFWPVVLIVLVLVATTKAATLLVVTLSKLFRKLFRAAP